MPIDEVIETARDERGLERIVPSGAPENVGTDVNTLYYEQGRLRAEMDRLRQDQRDDHQRSLLTQSAAAPSKDSGRAADGKQGQPEDPASGKSDQEPAPPVKGGDGKGAETSNGKPDKKPLTTRVLGWIREHPLATILGVVGFVVFVVCGAFLWKYLQSYESTDDAQVDGHLNAISSRIAGTVKSVSIENNQNVSRGELVVELDPRDYDVALAQQKGNLLQAQANLETQIPICPLHN